MTAETAALELTTAELWYLHTITTPQHLATPPDGPLARVTLELERALLRGGDTAHVTVDRIGVYGLLGLVRRGDTDVDGTPVGAATTLKLIHARVDLEDGTWPVDPAAPDMTFLGAVRNIDPPAAPASG